jgi:hypothetical protein
MALTIVVEDGTIVAGANSYLSVAEADAILEVDFRQWKVWDAQDADMKVQLLLMATRWLDENMEWNGSVTQPADPDADPPVVAQPLDWPRKYMKDCAGNCLADSLIPDELKKATAYLAVWLFSNDSDEILAQVGIKRFRNDTIEIEWQDAFTGTSATLQPPFLKRLLGCLGIGPGELGFKPIIRK